MEGGAPRQSFASRTHSTFLSHPGDAIVRTYLSDKEGQFSFLFKYFHAIFNLASQPTKFEIFNIWPLTAKVYSASSRSAYRERKRSLSSHTS